LTKNKTKLTAFGLEMLDERYFLPGETVEGLFKRVADANSDNEAHSKRLQQYMADLWFMPATPVLSNSGTDRGELISCFLNEVPDKKKGIFDGYRENFWLGAGGGGIGTDWSAVREVGANVGKNGQSSGIVPFIKVSDSATLAVSQGGLRRASQAVYLDVSHPEIEEFVEIRRPTGADQNRRSLNVHHGVKLSDEFMQALLDDGEWELKSPATGEIVKRVSAFDLFVRILTARIETGEPYIYYSDTAERLMPDIYRKHGLKVNMSNLCTEIMLATSPDRTAVCCLSSVNLQTYDEWKGNHQFIEDVVRFLDNVLQNFIDSVRNKPGYEKAVLSAESERSVGLGVMGFHGYLQEKSIPFESAMAEGFNRNVFKFLRESSYEASIKLGFEKGFAPLFEKRLSTEMPRRNVCLLSIAPTSSISIICGEATQGIEPMLANVYTHKNNVGTHIVRNPRLEKLIKQHAKFLPEGWEDEQWKLIGQNSGSVQDLHWMDQWDKDVFKTAYEIDQRWIISHAAVRQEFIDQGQSVNLFFTHDSHKQELFDVHVMAWKRGLKSLYYCRSTAANRAKVGQEVKREVIPEKNYEECLSCQ